MIDIDLLLKELSFFNTWAQRISSTLDGWGLTTYAVAQVKQLPATVDEINELVAQFKAMRERVDFFLERTPPVSTPDDIWDVMKVTDRGVWERYTIPTKPEV